ncbi:hypothetical protein [Synechococcus sp. KORDI-100]|uniref:hypothetical protein n=1 Tax=Synechococcus sp. KORDI-100 TaxID=1280380 RepID=UPI0012E0B9ED|nr:hypothetical protein [Synechococcus sp. KORDI-100]
MTVPVREKILDELIQIETWDWWKAQVFYLRERKEYAEAEAVFNEFKINQQDMPFRDQDPCD